MAPGELGDDKDVWAVSGQHLASVAIPDGSEGEAGSGLGSKESAANRLTGARGGLWAMDVTEYDWRKPKKSICTTGRIWDCDISFQPFRRMARRRRDCRFGPPLSLKRDNRGNLNHEAVNEVLSEFIVLPLNSPPYYAPYNGAIEESQQELKACLREKFLSDLPFSANHPAAGYGEVAVHDLNHRLRPYLNGKTSCQVFFSLAERPVFSN